MPFQLKKNTDDLEKSQPGSEHPPRDNGVSQHVDEELQGTFTCTIQRCSRRIDSMISSTLHESPRIRVNNQISLQRLYEHEKMLDKTPIPREDRDQILTALYDGITDDAYLRLKKPRATMYISVLKFLLHHFDFLYRNRSIQVVYMDLFRHQPVEGRENAYEWKCTREVDETGEYPNVFVRIAGHPVRVSMDPEKIILYAFKYCDHENVLRIDRSRKTCAIYDSQLRGYISDALYKNLDPNETTLISKTAFINMIAEKVIPLFLWNKDKLERSEWNIYFVDEAPQQIPNSPECGIYSVYFVENLLTYNGKHDFEDGMNVELKRCNYFTIVHTFKNPLGAIQMLKNCLDARGKPNTIILVAEAKRSAGEVRIKNTTHSKKTHKIIQIPRYL